MKHGNKVRALVLLCKFCAKRYCAGSNTTTVLYFAYN